MRRSADPLRELVQRLIIAEVLARPGEGPLVRRPLHARVRTEPVQPSGEQPAPSRASEEREP